MPRIEVVGVRVGDEQGMYPAQIPAQPEGGLRRMFFPPSRRAAAQQAQLQNGSGDAVAAPVPRNVRCIAKPPSLLLLSA